MMDKIIEEILPRIIEIRHLIHQNPEPAFKEHNTARIVVENCGKAFDEIKTGVVKTGVVGLLRGNTSEKTIALRADMDALPIKEKTALPYRSRNEFMHACGHDGHTAILIGVALVLSRLRSRLKGSVKFIFQPGEEGEGGGRLMCEEGVLKTPPVEAIFALHGFSDLPLGSIGIKKGCVCAAADKFEMLVRGKGAHGAHPHLGVDPIMVSASIMSNLQSIVSRAIDPLKPTVISVCKIEGGTAFNIIPEEVHMWGTIRAIDSPTQDKLHKLLKQIAQNTARAHSATCKVRISKEYPPTINDDTLAEFAHKVLTSILGRGEVRWIKHPVMGAEDFSFYLQKVPGLYLRLGVKKPSPEKTYPLHNSRFDFPDQALPLGIKALSSLALEYLKE